MRDNSKRFGAGAEAPPQAHEETEKPTLDFSVPTEIVDLPSKGRFYPPNHPLCGADTIEIRFMTAKDEDILTSPSLLKKGIAIDRFITNILVDKRIPVSSLLTGDKNAILISSRINGFGSDYTTKITCQNCAKVSENTFDLTAVEAYHGDDWGDLDITQTDRGSFMVRLPRTKFEVEFRPLTGREEGELVAKIQANKRSRVYETNLTDQLRKIIVSVNGVENLQTISQAINVLPAFDSRYLRKAYQKAVPGLDMTQHFACPSCGFEKEVDIPLTVDFFWSK